MSSDHNSDTCCHGSSENSSACSQGAEACHSEGRRDFLFMSAGAMAAVGAGSVVWPFVHQMNPAADTLAMSTTEVDVASVEPGQSVTVMWRGKPVFIFLCFNFAYT